MSLVTVADLKLRIRADLFYTDGDTAMSDARLQLHLDRAIAMLTTAIATHGWEPLTAPLPEDAIGHICYAAAWFTEVDRGFNPASTNSVYRTLYEDYVQWLDRISRSTCHPFGVPSSRSNATSTNSNGAYIGVGAGVGSASRLGARRGW